MPTDVPAIKTTVVTAVYATIFATIFATISTTFYTTYRSAIRTAFYESHFPIWTAVIESYYAVWSAHKSTRFSYRTTLIFPFNTIGYAFCCSNVPFGATVSSTFLST